MIEPDEESAFVLRKKGYSHVFNFTFEEYLKRGDFPQFTHIIMNPPFKQRLDLFFFNECFRLLSDHGRIASIVFENSIYEELQPLGFPFNIDTPSYEGVNYFFGLSGLLQEFIENLHNTKNCLMDSMSSFYNTSARAYYLLAEKRSKVKR